MANEVSIPVKLQLSNLQQIITDLQRNLGNLKVGSNGFKIMQSDLNKLQQEVDKLQNQTAKPFVNAHQFDNATKSVDKIEDRLNQLKINMSRIKFSDIQLDSTQQAELDGINDKIKQIQASLSGLKSQAKMDFLSTDLGKIWSTLDPSSATKSFDQITKNIEKAVEDQSRAVKKAESTLNDYQRAMNIGNAASKLINAKNPLSKAGMGEDFSKFFSTDKNGLLSFKAGTKPLFQEWLENNLNIDPNIASALIQKSASQVNKELQNAQSAIRQQLNQQVDKGQKAGTAYNEQALKYRESNAALTQLVNIMNAADGANLRMAASESTLQNSLSNAEKAAQLFQQRIVQIIQGSTSFGNNLKNGATECQNLKAQLQSTSVEFLKISRQMSNLNSMKMTIVNFMGFRQVINLVKQGIREALNTIKELDSVMNGISIVTDMSTGDLWNQIDAYSNMAQKYGVSIKGAYEVSRIYYQQGLDTANVMTLTNETLKLAKISGLDYAQTTDYMTTALRGFKMEMSEASTVVDVYANLAAHTAVSTEELAVAMSKTASSMESVGASFQETSAMIATMVAVTRESATNIGSALKSIAARYGEMKKDPLGLESEDGEIADYNKVDAALKSVGISLKDSQGQFRNMTDVILELSEVWDQLDSTQQRYIATQYAGNRQQSRFLALVGNKDLLKSNLAYAENADDTGTVQALKSLDSIEAKTQQVKDAYQQMYTGIGAADIWKEFLEGTKNVMNTLSHLPKLFGKIPIGAIAMVTDIINVIKGLGMHVLQGVTKLWTTLLPEKDAAAQGAAAGEAYAQAIIKALKENGGLLQEAGRQAAEDTGRGGKQARADVTSEASKPITNEQKQNVIAPAENAGIQQVQTVQGQIESTGGVNIPAHIEFDLGEFLSKLNEAKSLSDIQIAASIDFATTLDNIDSQFLPYLQNAIAQIDFNSPDAQGKLQEMINSFIQEAGPAGSQLQAEFQKIGEQGIAGLVIGLQQNSENASAISAAAGESVIAALKAAMGVASPSVPAMEAGKFVLIGLIQGLNEKLAEAQSTATQAGTSVIEALKTVLQDTQLDLNSLIKFIPPEFDLTNADLSSLDTLSEQIQAKFESVKQQILSDPQGYQEVVNGYIVNLETQLKEKAQMEITKINAQAKATPEWKALSAANKKVYDAQQIVERDQASVAKYTGSINYNRELSIQESLQKRNLRSRGEVPGAELDRKAAEAAEEIIRNKMKQAEDFLSSSKADLAKAEQEQLEAKAAFAPIEEQIKAAKQVVEDNFVAAKVAAREKISSLDSSQAIMALDQGKINADNSISAARQVLIDKEAQRKAQEEAQKKAQEETAQKAQEEAQKKTQEETVQKVQEERIANQNQELIKTDENVGGQQSISQSEPIKLKTELQAPENIDTVKQETQNKMDSQPPVQQKTEIQSNQSSKLDIQLSNLADNFRTSKIEASKAPQRLLDAKARLRELQDNGGGVLKRLQAKRDVRDADNYVQQKNNQVEINRKRIEEFAQQHPEYRQQANAILGISENKAPSQEQPEFNPSAAQAQAEAISQIGESSEKANESVTALNESVGDSSSSANVEATTDALKQEGEVLDELKDKAEESKIKETVPPTQEQLSEGTQEKVPPQVEPSQAALQIELPPVENAAVIGAQAGEEVVNAAESKITGSNIQAPQVKDAEVQGETAGQQMSEGMEKTFVPPSLSNTKFNVFDENGVQQTVESITAILQQIGTVSEEQKAKLLELFNTEGQLGNFVTEYNKLIGSNVQGQQSTFVPPTDAIGASVYNQPMLNQVPVNQPPVEVDTTAAIANITQLIDKLVEIGAISEEMGAKLKAALSSDAPERTQEKVDNLKNSLNNAGTAAETMGSKFAKLNFSSLGSAIRMFASISGLSDKAKGAITALGGAITLLGVGIKMVDAMSKKAAMTNPWMGIAMGVMGLVNGISLLVESDAEKLERLQKEAEEAGNAAKEAKANYKNAQSGLDKLDQLAEKRYESAEATQEYADAVDELAEKFPQLIDGYDEQGNAIINAYNAEQKLKEMRDEAAAAAYKASQAEQQKLQAEAMEKAKNLTTGITTWDYIDTTGSLLQYRNQQRQAIWTERALALGLDKNNVLSTYLGSDALSQQANIYNGSTVFGAETDLMKSLTNNLTDLETQNDSVAIKYILPGESELRQVQDYQVNPYVMRAAATMDEMLGTIGTSDYKSAYDWAIQVNKGGIFNDGGIMTRGAADFYSLVEGIIDELMETGQYKTRKEAYTAAQPKAIERFFEYDAAHMEENREFWEGTDWVSGGFESLYEFGSLAADMENQITTPVDNLFNLFDQIGKEADLRNPQQIIKFYEEAQNEYSKLKELGLDEDPLLKDAMGQAGSWLEQLTPQILELKKIINETTTNQKELVNDYYRSTYRDYAFMSDNTGMSTILSGYYGTQYAQDLYFDPNLTWDDWKAENATALEKGAESANEFYKEVALSGEVMTNKFIDMTKNWRKYHWEDFELFGLDQSTEYGRVVYENLAQQSKEIQDRLTKMVTESQTRLSKDFDIDDNFNFDEETLQKVQVESEAAFLNNIIKQRTKLLKAGYNNDANVYSNMMLSMFNDTMDITDTEVRNSIFSIIDKYGVTTSEGIDNIISAFEESDTDLDDGLIERLKKLRELIHESLYITFSSALDNYNESWKDNSKLLKSLTSGIDYQEMNNIINSSAGKKMGLSYDSFISDGDKLILSTEDALIYYSNFFDSEREKVKTASEKMEQFKSDYFTDGQFDVNKFVSAYQQADVEERSNLRTNIEEIIGIGSLKPYLDETTGTINDAEGLNKLVIEKWDDLTEAQQGYLKSIGFTEEQMQKSIAWNQGDFSSLNKIYENFETQLTGSVADRLKQLASGAAQMTEEERAQPDIVNAVKQIQSSMDQYINDLINNDIKTLYADDYVSSGRGKDLIAAEIEEAQNKTALEFAQWVAGLSKMAGQSINKQNDVFVKAWEKNHNKETLDGIKDIQFLDNQYFSASISQLKTFADTYGLSIDQMVTYGIAQYNEALDKWVVDYSNLDALGLDLNSIDGFQETVADSINSFFDKLGSLIKNALDGSITNVDAKQLQQQMYDLGFGEELDFTKTAKGLKLSEQSALSLYTYLKQTHSLQADLMFEQMNKSLQESNEHYKGISDIQNRIVELNAEIADLPVDDKRRQKYEEELALAKEILAVRSTSEDSSFNFMSNKIPGGQNNPINYYQNWAQAFQKIQEASTLSVTNATGKHEGLIDYQDWYNIVTEMNNIAKVSGDIKLGAYTLSGNAKDAAQLIEAGAQALTVDSSGNVKVAMGDIANLGIDFSAGAADFAGNVDQGIKDFAHSQVEMLDGMIQLMETIVAMEQLSDVDVNADNKLDLGEIFQITYENDGTTIQAIEGFTSTYKTALEKLLTWANGKEGEEFKASAEAMKISWGETNMTMWNLLNTSEETVKGWSDEMKGSYAAIVGAFYAAAMSGDYDPDNIMASVKEVLTNTGFEGEIELGDMRLVYKYNTVLEKGKDGKYHVGDKEFSGDEAGLKSAVSYQHATELNALQGAKAKQEEDGSVTFTNNIVANVDYNVEDGQYNIKFSKGGTATANSKAGANLAIATYAKMTSQEIDDTTTQGAKAEPIQFTIHQEGYANLVFTVKDGKSEVKSEGFADDSNLSKAQEAVQEVLNEVDVDSGVNTEVQIESIANLDSAEQAGKDIAEAAQKAVDKEPIKLTVEEDSNPNKDKSTFSTRVWEHDRAIQLAQEERERNAQNARNLTKGTARHEEEIRRTEEERERKAQNARNLTKGTARHEQDIRLAQEQLEREAQNARNLTKGTARHEEEIRLAQEQREREAQNARNLTKGTARHEEEIRRTEEERERKAQKERTLNRGVTRHEEEIRLFEQERQQGEQIRRAQASITYTQDELDQINLLFNQINELTEVMELQNEKDAYGSLEAKDELRLQDLKNLYQLPMDSQASGEAYDQQINLMSVLGELIHNVKYENALYDHEEQFDLESFNFQDILESLGLETIVTTAEEANNTIVEGAEQSSQESINAAEASKDAANNTDNAANEMNNSASTLDTAGTNLKEAAEAISNIQPTFGTTGIITGMLSGIRTKQTKVKGNTAFAAGTLMGELGPELVVSNGHYFVAGQNGAEFVDLDPDAIVFNHLQTASLFKNGMSKTRGKAITNERVATSFAKGNINGGSAQASASSALAALKQLRAQWQALESLSSKDLANKGGGGGGGGGDPAAFLKDLEKWYNWLQQIAQLEKEITYEETKRSKIQSDMIAHGQDYHKSQMETLKYLQQQLVVHQSLTDSQYEYFEKRRKELNEQSAFSALYGFGESGQLYYKDGALAWLSDLSGRNATTGEANYTAEEQYKRLVDAGFEFAMKYDSSGNEIKQEGTDWYSTALQAFWDKMDADKEEMQSLHDSVEEHRNAVLESQASINEIIRDIEDNQINVEQKVLKAIEDSRQREIDEFQKERDAIEKSSKALIDGLSEQLNLEKEMYSNQQEADEFGKLQRQLAILQRSGGSASQITDLQRQISEKQQNMYFDAQQQQIDALQKASDNQLERLDHQIELMTEQLEYEKENGLLWNAVYEVLQGSPESISEFIKENTKEYWGQSPTELTKTIREDLFEIQRFKELQETLDGGLDILTTLYGDEVAKKKAEKEKKEAEEKAKIEGNFAASTAGGSGGGNNSSPTKNKKWHIQGVAQEFNTEKQANDYLMGLIVNARDRVLRNPQDSQANTELNKWNKLKPYQYDIGGMVESTGPALLHAKESVLTASQTATLRNDILSNKPTSLLSLLTDFRDAYNNISNATNSVIGPSDGGIIIENATVEMNVSQIANDYDAQRAGEQALDRMVQIARKSQGWNRIGG